MAFKSYDLMIAVLPPDPDPCSEFTLGGPPPCPAFSEIPPAPNTPYCPDPPCPAFSEIPPDPPPCPGASLGGLPNRGYTGESALTALQIRLRETLQGTIPLRGTVESLRGKVERTETANSAVPAAQK